VGASVRIRKVATRKELEAKVDELCVQGFKVIEQGDDSCMLGKHSNGSGMGHLICFLCTFWFTLGIGNLVYALVAKSGAEKVLLKVDSES